MLRHRRRKSFEKDLRQSRDTPLVVGYFANGGFGVSGWDYLCRSPKPLGGLWAWTYITFLLVLFVLLVDESVDRFVHSLE